MPRHSRSSPGRRSWLGSAPSRADAPDRSFRPAVYAWVARIPFGQVATYGQIAALSGFPGRARQVGFALAGMPDGLDLPWHRVVNAQGKVSPRTGSCFHELQYVLLEREGITFIDNRIDLNRYRWQPEASGPGAAGVEGETSE